MELPTGRSRLLWQLLLLLLSGACHAQFDEVHDESEAWLQGVYTPQPLRAAPWQLKPVTPPPPPPPPSGGVLVPGVGQVIGQQGYKFIKNRPIDAFLGIRYALVNSGLGRFQAATAAPYQPIINATQSSPNCAQFPEVQRLQAAESRGENVDDCLTLDIYAPAGGRELPVLVFVHGEMLFDGGAEEAQPDYLLEHDVILVSVNYRLAPFGFLAALTDELPGNVALSDLHQALEWVQRNIRYFGGASGQITVVGQAGGATLAHALSLSPKTQHLFQQLILQSGTALNPYLIDERPLDTLATFAQLARCPSAGRNLSPLYECLRRLRTSQLASIFQQLLQQNEPRGLSFLGGFKLVVGDALGYLPEHPAALVASNSANNTLKPAIIGATKDASAFIVSRFYDQIQRLQSQNISDYINVVLRHTAPPQQHKIWHDLAVREIFTPEQLRYVTARSVSQGLVELSNLILYRAPVVYSIRSSYKKNPTYLYTFDYRGEYHRFAHFGNPLPFGVDASLSDDSVYLFPYPKDASNLNPEDKSLARALVAMWVSFAQTGIPNPNPNVWPKASSEYGPFLRFTNSRQSILELDQHFGESINVPNIYAQYFNTTSTSTSTTTTTTTTTRRPYYPQQPYRPPQQPEYRPPPLPEYRPPPLPEYRPPQQPEYRPPPLPEYRPPQQPEYRPPQVPEYRPPAFNDYYARQQEVRRQQLLREQEERELKLREQQEREQQQQEALLREEEERQREELQRQAELQREKLLREQFEREQRQREELERENAARQDVDEDNEDEPELQQSEYELRQQQEREQEREQQPQLADSEEQRLQQEREEQERAQEERDQESREQHEREQQQREQLEREQQGRGEQAFPADDENPPDPSAYPTYEDYVKAYTSWVEELNNRDNPENFASAEQEGSPDDAPFNDLYAQPDEDPLYSDNTPRRIKLMRRYRRPSI
ncbi:glutactin isoform X2 [Drosophila navojoa]|uniref:glutactin isoform X2 n=1 Tax=Drosophila navojoa TaxID=7232 RepID=UPI0011BD96D1|nr:glutactin isoform X2 [Drosophila navojoa]